MNRHVSSASDVPSASILLPTAEATAPPLAQRTQVERGAFTKARVRNLRCSAPHPEKLFWDGAMRGFGIRALRSGKRSWIFQYRDQHGRTRRMVLGDVDKVSLEVAREKARKQAAAVVQGVNPSAERKKRRRAGVFIETVEAYLSHAKGRQRARSYQETERHLRVHAAPLHHDRVEAIGRDDIASVLFKVGQKSGPVAANRLRAALSALWTWSLRMGLIETGQNPVAFTLRNPEKSRERILSPAELRSIWQATEDESDYSRIVRLCLLTGCRREEIGGLLWSEIGTEWITIQADRMKGKLAHEIPLLPAISALLRARSEANDRFVFGRGENGFSGWSKSKSQLDAKITKLGQAIPP